MNFYLVLLSHTMDDLPIAAFNLYSDAKAFAEKVKPMPAKAIRNVFNTDCSTPCCVSIVTFQNGKPVDCEVVRDLSD